jgi:hypothetical protein
VIWLLILSLAGIGLLAVLYALALGDTWFEWKHRQDEAERVTGPIPLYVRRIPTGVVLDLEPFAQHVVHDIVTAVREDDAVWDQFAQAAAGDPVDVDRLSAELTDRVSTRLPLYGQRAAELGERLRAMAPAEPSQEWAKRGAA